MDATHLETVEEITDSLEYLNDVLNPLLASPLDVTLSELGPIERAKMQVLLAYVTQDLIFSKQKQLRILLF
jgi:exosome complex protein LRP1